MEGADAKGAIAKAERALVLLNEDKDVRDTALRREAELQLCWLRAVAEPVEALRFVEPLLLRSREPDGLAAYN
jgi:predicted nuclease of predicted toxin-antitoxin system